MEVAIERLKVARSLWHIFVRETSKDITRQPSSVIENMFHLGPRTFDELSGEVVQNTAVVAARNQIKVWNSPFGGWGKGSW